MIIIIIIIIGTVITYTHTHTHTQTHLWETWASSSCWVNDAMMAGGRMQHVIDCQKE